MCNIFFEQIIPAEFVAEYGEKLPDVVHLHTHSGPSWDGIFVKNTGIVEGLESMISFYSLRPYHAPLLVYKGNGNFSIHIFNSYAVEIEYSVASIASDEIGLNKIEVQNDKLDAAFQYNAYNPKG